MLDVSRIRAVVIHSDLDVLSAAGQMADGHGSVSATTAAPTATASTTPTAAASAIRATAWRSGDDIVGVIDVTGVNAVIIHSNFNVGIGRAARCMADRDGGMATAWRSVIAASALTSAGVAATGASAADGETGEP